MPTRLRDIAAAIASSTLDVHYQPIVDLRDYQIVSFEALSRWPLRGRGTWRSPDTWIPAMENSDLRRPFHEWLIGHVLADIVDLRTRISEPLPVAVNLSPTQVADSTFAPALMAALDRHGLSPDSLEFEVTERHFQANQDAVRVYLAELRALGCTIALDDYGTGDSSLQSLVRLPFDRIKIDKAFIQNLPGDPVSAAIVDSTVLMAHRVGLTVVAEGVERFEQMDFLRQVGCDLAQGYLFGAAQPPEKLQHLVQHWPERRDHFSRGRVGCVPHVSSPLVPGHQALAGLRVLAVDDETMLLEITEEVLSHAGAEVVTTPSVARAISLIQKSPPDVVLSDIHMPGLNGWDFIQLVRHEAPGTIVIAMSGYLDERMRMIRRPDGVLAKPYQPEQLVETVRSAVAARRAA